MHTLAGAFARTRRTGRFPGMALLLALLLAWGGEASAHGLQRQIGTGQALVITISDDDGAPFAFEDYSVYPAGAERPVQVGRTDQRGRIAFLPDRAGTWRVRAYSKNGHGLDFTFTSDAAARIVEADKPFIERHARLAIGVAALLGLFGFLAVYVRRRVP